MTSFSMPHWSDPVVCAVAEAIYDDAIQHTALAYTRSEAVKCWPGFDALRFVAMMRAYTEATTANPVGTKAEGRSAQNTPPVKTGEGGT